MFKVGYWCYFLTILYDKHYASSFLTDSSDLGKYTFVLSSNSELVLKITYNDYSIRF